MRWFRGLLLALFMCFGFVFVNSTNTFAVDDYSVTYSKSALPGTLLSGQDLSLYKYLIVECIPDSGSNCLMSNASNSTYVTNYSIRSTSSTYCSVFSVFPSSNMVIYELCSFEIYDESTPSFPKIERGRNNIGSNTSNFSLKFTFSDSLPTDNCPVCEVCQECPVIPEYPYDNKLDNIVQAIYVCAATLLVLYFFYCIYRLIIRNSGVK